jgi:hypothetical protein
VAGCTGRSHNTSYAARAVLVFWGGPVLVARAGVRTCRCALGRLPLTGAVLVGRWPQSLVLRWWLPLERLPTAAVAASTSETDSATCTPGLQLFGFNGWFSSPVRGRERGPFSSSVCPEAVAAAVLPPETEVVAAAGAVVVGEPPGVCYPAVPLVWRLFIPVGVEPEFRL